LGMAGGLAGSELGRGLAMSDTAFGRFGQSAQRLVLKAENKSLSGLRSIFGSNSEAQSTAFRDPNLRVEDLQFKDLSWAQRQRTLLNNRINQFDASDPQMNMYYGSLHGHSVYSDGMGLPAEIYAKAKSENYDFMAITDHSHTAARGGVKEGDPRWPGQQKVPTVAENPAYYTETINAAKAASEPGKFAGIYGVEMGTIGKTGGKGLAGVNHINILQTETFFQSVKEAKPRVAQVFDPIRGVFSSRVVEPAAKAPDVVKINDGDYKALVDHLDKITDSSGGRPVVQLNHPRWTADESADLPAALRGRDYGQKAFKSHKEWVDRFGKYASQMEIINGDAIAPKSAGEIQARHIHDTDYAGYIDKGLKISPTFGRDFHYGDPGGTKAATGIMAKSLDTPALLDALRARRTIATTNYENLTGSMTVNNVHPMGSVLDQNAVPDLNIKVKIGGKISPEAEYKALLWGDSKIGDGKLAQVIQTKSLSGAELAKAGNSIAFDQVNQKLGATGAYYVEIQRIPPTSEMASSGLVSRGVSAGGKNFKLDSGTILTHTAPEVVTDPNATFKGDRMWTTPVWSEPLAGMKHSLAVRALVGLGGNLLSH
ncbi:MAG: PHP domain-containing protein, partial [Candidatus Obscuribacterales bacterium]|nr:PHP domain-containing protein [Candidatus Obscuribacterales bacterium]